MTTAVAERREEWARDGFFVLPSAADDATCAPMLERVTDIVRAGARGENVSPALLLREQQAGMAERAPEASMSKVFRLHRDPVFNDFATRPVVVDVVAALLGTAEVDCFLSQFIFKLPGAWGQPWHQDSYYFPFEPPRPVVGVWLAVTAATVANGCLQVLPGSQRDPVREHVGDRRPGANFGYMEIVDVDEAAAVPVLMDPGDVLVFDSHLMHRSTDNTSDRMRAAMVYHYATAGTIDHSEARLGFTIHDWMPVRRTV